MQKKYDFTLFSLEEFDCWLQECRFNRAITLLQNHHTWLPNYGSFTGSNHFALLKAMNDAHLERGFDMIAQNVTTFPDGSLAVCRPIDRVPAGIKGANSTGICIEHLGNFDGTDSMNDRHSATALRVNALLCREFNLTPSTDTIVYHHWYDLTTGQRTDGSGNTKTCPGTSFFSGNTTQRAAAGFIPLVAQYCAAAVPASNPSASPEGKLATVTALSSLNIRNAPTADAAIVGTLRRGAQVRIYAEQNGWCRTHPSEPCWVSARYLTISAGS